MNNNKKKEIEYMNKYGHIPKDFRQRLEWMYDQYNITDEQSKIIINERNRRLSKMYYTMISVVLYQDPQGAKRPRYRIIDRKNVLSTAKSSDFVHVYSPDAAYNNSVMKRMVTNNELDGLSQLICTPCDVYYRSYFKTPSYYSNLEKIMCEIGLTRAPVKPDFDNIEKAYADMYNSNVWLDDMLTIEGRISKYYSILPRVEIDLLYLNASYNKYQYDHIVNRKDFDSERMNLYYV